MRPLTRELMWLRPLVPLSLPPEMAMLLSMPIWMKLGWKAVRKCVKVQ